MGHDEARLVDLLVTEEEQVEVDRPRPPLPADPLTPEPPLDVEQLVEERAGREARLDLRGRVQRFTQARQAPGETRPSWLVLGDLLGALGKQTSFFLPSEVFSKLAGSHKSFAGLSYDSIGFKGLPVVDAPPTAPKKPVAVGAA